MKTLQLELFENKAKITNDPIYIESGEKVEFVVTNPGGELFYSTGDKNIRIIDARFTMEYDQLKSLDKFNIIVKSGNLYPEIYEVIGLKIHDITVIGASLDEKYPDVIKDIYNKLETHSKAIIGLYDFMNEINNKGVIE